MSMIFQTASNIGTPGYLPEFSATIKNAAISAIGGEVFDLGENWKNIYIVWVTCINGVVSTSQQISVAFADTGAILSNHTLNVPLGAMGANVPIASTTRPPYTGSYVDASVGVICLARFVRVRYANGSTAAQAANTYIDLRCFSLTP